MMYRPAAYWVPSETWHTLKWPRGERRTWKATPGLAGSSPAHSQYSLSSFTLPSPHLGCPTSQSHEEVQEWMAEVGYIFVTLFFSPSNNRYMRRNQPSKCFQIHNLRDTFQKALLLQQQCSFHRPCVSVPPEKKHPQRVLEAMAPSEGSLAAVCSNSWGLVPHYPKTAS